MRLYEIPAEFDAINYELEMSGGEITPELEQRMREALEGGIEKVEAAACVVRSLEADAEACAAEAKRLSDRATSLTNNSKRLKGLMLEVVDRGFDGKVKTAKFSIWGQTSAAGFDVILKSDLKPGDLPDCYMKVTTELRKKELIDAYKKGDFVPFAEQMEIVERPGTRFLRIK